MEVSVPENREHIAPEGVVPPKHLGAPPRRADKFVEIAGHDHDAGQEVSSEGLLRSEIFAARKGPDAFVSVLQTQLPRLVEEFCLQGHSKEAGGTHRKRCEARMVKSDSQSTRPVR